jgi:tight adherence protein B
VTAALAAVALAGLLWPDRRTERLRLVRRPGAPGRGRRPEVVGLPLPALAAATAALGTAAVSTALVALLAAVLAAVAVRAWQDRSRADRTGVQLGALTEGLGALAAELRSGRSLAAATDAAVTACGDEECGRSLARAVRAPATAPPGSRASELSDALRRISAAVLLSTRTGCSLAGVLGAVEDDLRARRRHRAELRTATAGPGASAMVLAALPLLGLAMGSGVGADPWRVLTTTGTGQILLVTGIALELAGVTWSRRLIQRAVR